MIVTMKEARPIARRDFVKGGEHGSKGFRGGRRLLHVRQECFVGLAHHGCRQLVVIGEQMSSTMHPSISLLDIRPQGGGFGEPLRQKREHAFELTRQAPFSETRVSEAVMAAIRVYSLRPGAVSGGLPSSVKALRTARQ